MAYIYDLTDTWNAGGTTFNAIKMNVTDSASAVASKLVSLQTNGTEHFSVTKAGVGYVSGNLGVGTSSPVDKLSVTAGRIRLDQDYQIVWQNAGTNRARIAGDSGNNIIFENGSANTERMRINASGNVGIGITNPQQLLALGSSTDQVGAGVSGTVSTVYFGQPSNLTGGIKRIAYDRATGSMNFIGGTVASPSTQMTLDSSGNVGIGTASPGYKLTVAGSGGTATVSLLETGVRSWGIRVGGASTNTFDIADFTAGTSRLLIDGNGNVGIGTASPSSKLTVAASNVTVNAGYGIAFTGDQTRIMTPEDNVYGALINWGAAGGCRFIAGTSERMRIDGSGNLLVGKSSTGSEVTTDGAVFYKNASGGGMTTYLTNGGVGTVLAVSTQGDTQAIIFFRSGSNVGNISVTTTATAYNTSSDYRLKDIDGPVANSGAYIDALKPVQGSWKADGSRFIGLLAHEAQEVSETPIATGEKDGEEMQAMDYSAPEIIANLIAELQSVRARLAQLEGN